MHNADRLAAVERTLHRLAEEVGDITGPVMSLYYARCPEAKTAFETHAQGKRGQLEGEMVERALYCLMYWFDSPGEVEILLAGSIPHHADTLQVPPRWYCELIEATADVIARSIPLDDAQESAVWSELRAELAEILANSSAQVDEAILQDCDQGN